MYQKLLQLSLYSTEVHDRTGFSLFVRQMKELIPLDSAALFLLDPQSEVILLRSSSLVTIQDYSAFHQLFSGNSHVCFEVDDPGLPTAQRQATVTASHCHLFRLKADAFFILFTQQKHLLEEEYLSFFHKILHQLCDTFFRRLLSNPVSASLFNERQQKQSPEEENYELIVNSISDGIVLLNLKNEIIFVNERMCEMSGYPLSEILGKNAGDILFNPETVSPFLAKVQQTFAGSAASYELDHLHKITKKPWRALVKGGPYYKEGQIAGAIGIISDITEIKKTERALKESEERYRLLFENGFDGIIIFDRYLNKPVACNRRVLDYFGCTEEEFLKKNPLDFSPEFQSNGYSSKAYREKILKQLSHETMVRYEWDHLRSDGTILYTEVSTFSLPFPNDNIRISILKDISERKRHLKALRESTDRLSMALDAGQLGTWEWNILTGETIYNTRWAEMLGYELDEIDPNDQSFDKLVHPDDLDRVREVVRKHIEGKTPFFEIEIRMISKSGEVKWIYDRGKVTQKGENGQPLRASGIHLDLTERRKYQVELRRSEELFRNYFEYSPFGIAIREIDNPRFARVNNKMAEIFGYSKAELKTIHRKELVYQEDRKDISLYMKQLIEGEISSFSVEKQYRKKNGEVFWAVATRSIVRQDDKTYLLGFIEDISERKAAEAQVRQSEARLREAQRLAHLGNWEIEIESQRIDWSEETYRILGFDLQKTAPKFETYINCVHPDDRPILQAAFEEAITNGESYELEIRHYTTNKRLIYTFCTGKPLYQDQKIVKIFGTIQDVTERKITDHALRETTEKYIDLFENMSDALILVNKEGYFVDANKAAQRMLGYPLSELSRLSMKDLIYEEDLPTSSVYFQKLLEEGAYSDYQGRIVTKSGEIKYLQVNSNAILDERGDFVGSRDIARDITELKIAERKRETLLRELEEVNQELKEFAYVVSHDLKAPLRAISSLAQWLSEDYRDQIDEEGQQQLRLLTQRVSRMHNFIEGILEYSRIGRIKIEKEEIDLNLLIKNISENLNPPAQFSIKIVSPLPKISAAKIRMEQLFQNLISNAIKYNDKENGWLKISYEDQEEFHFFRLEDNGMGIDEKYFEKIFQIFQTLQARDKFESTGIGLTIVKRIVQLNGGEITLSSEVSKGTTFEFSLKK